MPNGKPYETLFARHRSARVPTLWGWQSEVLATYATVGGDAAVELQLERILADGVTGGVGSHGAHHTAEHELPQTDCHSPRFGQHRGWTSR